MGKNKTLLLKNGRIQRLIDPIDITLSTLETSLELKLEKLNQGLALDKVSMFSISNTGKSKWSKSLSKLDNSVNHSFFDQIKKTDIVSIMQFVQEQTNFLDSFEHISPSGNSKPVKNLDLLACILGNGLNCGSG